jgi:hypothetical protein
MQPPPMTEEVSPVRIKPIVLLNFKNWRLFKYICSWKSKNYESKWFENWYDKLYRIILSCMMILL